MNWTSSTPTEPGTYRWRETDDGRIHSVILNIKRGTRSFACKTMDAARVASGGQWQKKAEAERPNDLRVELRELGLR